MQRNSEAGGRKSESRAGYAEGDIRSEISRKAETNLYIQAYILKASDVAVMAIRAKKIVGKFGLKMA